MHNPATINRLAVTLLPSDRYFEWTKTCPNPNPNLTLESLQDEGTVYLLPSVDFELEKQMRGYYPTMFEEQLFAWCTDESYWPKKRTYKMFQSFFDISFSSDVWNLADRPHV